MSIKNNAIIVATCVIGLGLGYSVSSMWSAAFKNSANPSSSSFASQSPGGFVPPKLGKHLAVIVTEIVKPAQIPENGEDEMEIVGRITLQQDIDGDLEYRWTLPEGVTVVEGVLSDGIANARAGQVIEVKIQVTGFTRENQKVLAFEAHGLRGEMKYGNSSILASRPEDSMESFAPQLKAEAARQLEAPPKRTE